MFSHVTLGVSDLAAAGAFYDALLLPLGLVQRAVMPDGGPASLCWHEPGILLPRFYAYLPFDRQPCSAGNGTMVAFLAPSPDAVVQSHAGAVAAGGADDGPPGPRAQYGPDYFGAYLRDPDGNKVHIVYRGPATASAQAGNTAS
ncbi:MAG: VOC family protein [Sphingomonadales bacterium]|nr:MAG: VOC family protein [Sphingomonadales bacterium]